MIEQMSALNALAGSAFVALILLMIGMVFLFRLYIRALDGSDKAWGVVGDLTAALRDNNTLVDRALDAVERRRD